MERFVPRQPEQPARPDAQPPPPTPTPEQLTQPQSGDLTPGEAVVLPRKLRTRRTTPLTPEEQMQKTEQRRRIRNESTRKYYKKLKEQAAQGDDYAKEILDRQKAAVREEVKKWRNTHPDLHRQYQKKWAQSERGREYLRAYDKMRYERKKKARQAQAE